MSFVLIISIFVTTFISLGILYIIWTLEVYSTSRFYALAGAVFYGMFAFVAAYFIQSSFMRAKILTFNQVSLFNAPFLEELLKAAPLFFLAWRMYLRYNIEGTAYGFAIGTGFALSENILYINSNPTQAMQLGLLRVFSTSMVHTFTCGVVGTYAGSSIHRDPRTLTGRLLGIWLLAVLFHAIYNFLVVQIESFWVIFIALGIGTASIASILFLINRSIKLEGQTIAYDLKGLAGSGELAAVSNIHQMVKILYAKRQNLGEERIKQVEQYLSLIAQRGMLCKTIALNQRPEYTDQLQKRLDRIEDQIDNLKSRLGLYTWAWLRSVVPSEESDIWDNLAQELQNKEPVIKLINELSSRQAEILPEELAQRKEMLIHSSLFADMKDQSLEELALMLHRHTFAVLDEVIAQGTVDERLYFVVEGSLIATTEDECGNETIISAYKPGDTFGEMSMLDQGPYTVQVSSMSDTILYSLSRADFLTIFYARPQVGLEMMRQLVAELRRQTALIRWVRQTGSDTPDTL